MSVDLAIRLRLLAQDYHDGRIDLPAYRALRAPILDSLVLNVYSVKAAMEATQPRAAARAIDSELTQPGKPLAQPRAQPGPQPGSPSKPQSQPQSLSQPPRNSRAIVIASVALLAVAAAVAVWLSIGSGDAPSHEAGAVTARNDEAFHRLIDEFTDRGDWGDAQLAPLNAALLELGGARMAASAHEPWFQHFVDELRRRLKEQQALSPAALTSNNSPLAALAVTVGFDLQSPDAAIHIASLPPPAAAGDHGPSPGEETSRVGTGGATKGSVASAVTESGQPAAQSSAAKSARAADVDGSSPTTGAAAPMASVTGRPGAAIAANSASGNVSATVTAAVDAQNTCRLELIRSRRPLCQDALPIGGEGPLMAMVPAGAFDMGSNAAAEEQPVHHVTIREPFAISVYEVSQGDFKQFCEHTKRACAPQPWVGDDYPAVSVSWDDARAYAEWLSSVTHHRYSLPTEAQWEYAARAGQAGPFPGGDSLSPTDAHYSMLTKQTVAARRSQKFNANAFRLVHTVGNVREWVEDAWTQGFTGAPADGSAMKSAAGARHVARGGSYADGAARLRLSMREGLPADTRDITTGFRIVRELP